MAPPTTCDSAVQSCFHGCWLSSTEEISHRNLLPHIPSTHLSVVISSPRPGIAPQSLNTSSQLLHPHPGCVWLQQGLSHSHSISCHRSAVSLSAFNVSPLTQTIALLWGSDPCFWSSPTNPPVFPPCSFILLSFVWFDIFFCTSQVLLSALSWCSACTSVCTSLPGERCTFCPTTPPPS